MLLLDKCGEFVAECRDATAAISDDVGGGRLLGTQSILGKVGFVRCFLLQTSLHESELRRLCFSTVHCYHGQPISLMLESTSECVHVGSRNASGRKAHSAGPRMGGEKRSARQRLRVHRPRHHDAIPMRLYLDIPRAKVAMAVPSTYVTRSMESETLGDASDVVLRCGGGEQH